MYRLPADLNPAGKSNKNQNRFYFFICWVLLFTYVLHTDAFFLSLRDINRHRSWLDFWKIQVNLVNFLSCTFGGDWGKYPKNCLTFGCLAIFFVWDFFIKNFFFPAETKFWKCYSNICANLRPVLKNLRTGLSKSVEKSTKYWKL